MDMPQCAAAIQHDEVVMRCALGGKALGGKVLRQRDPLAACRQDVENRIEHFPNIHMPFAPSMLRRLNEGLN